ncbi:cytochrome-c peroxidase [Lacihabitans sp. CCS-44]|uniref:cytochrome-c peroxidase n=1 Tax=Lacihabitans sp. CCS-44 TaxID=2487331 RepID=UPI0020CCC937|nr:cytochrome c peroxidase [Lacihabitans sp. CCS-44]MCP9756295.1 cytochrome-c peroxidase [Lacihabitans sp. CCS-44]
MVKSLLLICLVFLFSIGCKKSDKEEKLVEENEDIIAALPLEIPFPLDNPITKEKAELGKLLFFDPILSGNKDVACATCHHPEFGFAENLELSIGVNGHGFGSKRAFKSPNTIPFVKRNSQSIVNVVFNGIKQDGNLDPSKAPMFWDLRVESLEKQALEPIKTMEEMRGKDISEEIILDRIMERLRENKVYFGLFERAFGSKNSVSIENLGKALATYQRTIVANNSRFDKYLRGDESALSFNEIEGMKAFGKSGCIACHNGPMFSDFELHVLGVIDNEKLGFSDMGKDNKYGFRTPSLRNLRLTAPYMHSGKLKTLKHVLEFYEDLAGDVITNPKVKASQIDPKISKLKVNFKDISAIVEFLGTLNDESYDKTIPKKVPSGLKVGGSI